MSQNNALMDLDKDSALIMSPDHNLTAHQARVSAQNASGVDCVAHRIRQHSPSETDNGSSFSKTYNSRASLSVKRIIIPRD